MIGLLCLGLIIFFAVAAAIGMYEDNNKGKEEPPQPAPSVTEIVTERSSLVKRLLEAQHMLDDQLLNEEEYKDLKKRILRDG